MTMHLERGLTTTSNKKRKTKITKAQQEEFERGWRDRNKFLKSIQLPKETFEQYMEWVHGKGGKTKTKAVYVPETKKTIAEETSRLSDEHDAQSCPKSKSAAPDNRYTEATRSRPWRPAPPTAKPAPTYTGTKVLGIAVLHKSCLQPVFSQEEAEDVARMRR